METKILIRSGPKPNAVNPPPQWCFWWNLITISRLISEIFMFESVDRRTDRRTDGCPLDSHPISSPWAFGSGELKSVGINMWCLIIFLLLLLDCKREQLNYPCQGTKVFQYCTCTCPAGGVTYNFNSPCKHMHLSFKSVSNKNIRE